MADFKRLKRDLAGAASRPKSVPGDDYSADFSANRRPVQPAEGSLAPDANLEGANSGQEAPIERTDSRHRRRPIDSGSKRRGDPNEDPKEAERRPQIGHRLGQVSEGSPMTNNNGPPRRTTGAGGPLDGFGAFNLLLNNVNEHPVGDHDDADADAGGASTAQLAGQTKPLDASGGPFNYANERYLRRHSNGSRPKHSSSPSPSPSSSSSGAPLIVDRVGSGGDLALGGAGRRGPPLAGSKPGPGEVRGGRGDSNDYLAKSETKDSITNADSRGANIIGQARWRRSLDYAIQSDGPLGTTRVDRRQVIDDLQDTPAARLVIDGAGSNLGEPKLAEMSDPVEGVQRLSPVHRPGEVLPVARRAGLDKPAGSAPAGHLVADADHGHDPSQGHKLLGRSKTRYGVREKVRSGDKLANSLGEGPDEWPSSSQSSSGPAEGEQRLELAPMSRWKGGEQIEEDRRRETGSGTSRGRFKGLAANSLASTDTDVSWTSTTTTTTIATSTVVTEPPAAPNDGPLIDSYGSPLGAEAQDESLLWLAGQYLYMRMRAFATSSVYGVQVDVEWSNERVNGTNIDLVSDSAEQPNKLAAGQPPVGQTAGVRHYARNRQVAPFATIDLVPGQDLHLQCTGKRR